MYEPFPEMQCSAAGVLHGAARCLWRGLRIPHHWCFAWRGGTARARERDGGKVGVGDGQGVGEQKPTSVYRVPTTSILVATLSGNDF